MYSLGQRLRNYYSDFLPNYWPIAVNVSSSPVERCLVSAQLVSAGLFPPHDELIWNPDLLWQPIPTHYLPRDQDNVTITFSYYLYEIIGFCSCWQ